MMVEVLQIGVAWKLEKMVRHHAKRRGKVNRTDMHKLTGFWPLSKGLNVK